MIRHKFPSETKNFFIHLRDCPFSELHCHDFWEFTIITKGKMLHKIGAYERVVEQDTLLVIRPNDNHTQARYEDEEVEYINFGVREDVLKTTLSVLSDNLYDFLLLEPYIEYPLSKTSVIYFNNMFNKFHTTILDEQSNDLTLPAIFVSIIRELLQCVNPSKQKAHYSPTINEFIEAMRKPENLVLSIDEIIQNINYSHCHLLRLFKQETGTTPSKYFLKNKLNYARVLLETSTLSITNIASLVGFASVGHFTKVFKEEYASPPATYRKNWQNYYNSLGGTD